MRRLPLLLWLPLVCGCASLYDFNLDDPPRVNKSWANQARAVVSPDTPMEEERTPYASYGPADDRDRDELEDLDGEEDLGEVVIKLKEGRYLLEGEVTLENPTSVTIVGKGPTHTRLELDTENLKSINIIGAKKVVLRGLTVAGITGGGIFIKGCPEVVVDDVHFAGLRFGLALTESTASVTSSVFAGCQTGIRNRDGRLKVHATAFTGGWEALAGTGGAFDVRASVFLDNREVLDARVDRRTTLVSCLFFGEKQELEWQGKPRLAAHNLAHFRHLGNRLGRQTNVEIRDPNDFPQSVGWPDTFDVVNVHLALERSRIRGEKGFADKLEVLRNEQAELFAKGSQKALAKRDIPAARKLAKLALEYYGNRPLKDAPQAVVEIAELAK